MIKIPVKSLDMTEAVDEMTATKSLATINKS